MFDSGGVILGRESPERPPMPVALRLQFGVLTGPAAEQAARHAAELALLSMPAVHDVRPNLLRPSGVPAVEPEIVGRERIRQQLGAMVRPSGLPLFPARTLRRWESEPESDDYPDEPLWASLPPGVELAEVVDDIEPRALDVDDLVRLVHAHTKLIAHHEAGAAEAMAALTRRSAYSFCSNGAEETHDRIKAAADEISAALMWTPSHADAQLRIAMEWADELPATLDALRAGLIDAYKARIIADETASLLDQPDVRVRVEQAALAVAGKKSGPQLRAFVKKQVIAAAPETAEQRRRRARQRRRVDRPFPECDGMGSMSVHGPIEDLVALHTAIDAAARARRLAARKAKSEQAHPDATASLDELRFDVLTGLGWSGLAAGHLGCCADDCPGIRQRLGTEHGRPARIGVTVPLTTLIGVSDEAGVLHGYGPITAEVARRIAADGTWRRLLTDPKSGALLDYGTTRYEPPQDLAEFVIARDRTCRFPPCNWTAEASQLDHTDPHRSDGSGGATADYNLGAWHDRHHNSKTSHGWIYCQPEPGRFTMTSPAGLVYEVDPEVIGPVLDQPDPPEDSSGRESQADPDPPLEADRTVTRRPTHLASTTTRRSSSSSSSPRLYVTGP
jgi:hypothetical protein